MDSPSPDQLVCNDHWSDLRQFRELPSIDSMLIARRAYVNKCALPTLPRSF